jgi:hypothetical protein
MKRTFIFLIVLSAIAAPVDARTTEFTLHAMKASAPAKTYTLLPKADEQTDADAVPHYEKAIQSLPDSVQMEEINQWLKTPPDELPQKEVQAVLEKLEPSLKLLEQAAKCKQCDWPYMYDDEITEYLRTHRKLTSFLALKMRFQIAQSRYDDAIDTAQTGFAVAKHVGEGRPLIRGMLGIALAAYTCRQLEAFVQRPDAPNLYEALRDFPRPFVGLIKKAKWEEPKTKAAVRLLTNRLGRHVAVLQCVEAMRLHAAANNGTFPGRLSDITQVPVPNDPATGKPFAYSRTGSKAVLEIPPMGEETDRDTMRYELSLVE